MHSFGSRARFSSTLTVNVQTMQRLSAFFLVSVATIGVCAAALLAGCDLLGASNSPDGYPAVLEPLPEAELTSLRREFVRLHEGRICTGLNRFGLTGGGVCTTGADSIAIADTAHIKQLVKEQLTRYARYTNVESPADIRFQDIYALQPDTDWRVIAAEQRFEGHRVLNSSIYVFLTGSGVYRINGHWYENILIPREDTYTPEEVKDDLVGQTLTYHDFGGGEQTFTITSEALHPDVEKVIVPVNEDDRIKLHVTWQVAIGEEDRTSWYLYIDTTSGKRVHKIQLFET